MFTGLIEQVGRIERIEPLLRTARLVISAPGIASRLTLGESVAVDGTCLTVETATSDAFTAFASEETLARTTLGAAAPGREANLERALRLGDRLGGHLVSGHVDATGALIAVEPVGEGFELRVSAPPEILEVSVPKGSITVDGISLTLVEIGADWFSVALIPHTLRHTALRTRKPGERLNLESDLLGKYVAKMLRARLGGGNGPSAKAGIGGMFDLLGL